MKEETLFIKILKTVEGYGVGGSKIKYSTPLARILNEVVIDHYKTKRKWWKFWK